MLALLLTILGGTSRVLEARGVPWSETRAVFPEEWVLPEELWRPSDPARDLPRLVADLATRRFDAPREAPWMASLGDLVAEQRRRGGTRAALEQELAELLRARPATHAAVAGLLREVLVADALLDRKWDPDDDRDDDGIYFGPLLERARLEREPWSKQAGARTLHQAATLVHADLDALFAALHDYEASFRDRGTSYEKLDPQPPSIVRGTDGPGGPFAALRLSIRSDLPFPFSHYDCELGVLHRLDEQGHVRTFVYSPSPDFHWLAGADFHLPLRTSGGEWVGTLLVRLSGFDLRGVPDGDENRKAGTRAALGNLRRRAEADFARSGGVPRTIDGALPALRVVARAERR